MDRPVYSRRVVGCLILTLMPSILVVGLFFLTGMFMLVFKAFGLRAVDPQIAEPTSWFSIVVTLLFSFPILVLLCRALYGAVIYVRTGRTVRIVTWRALLPASVILGLPGLVFSVLGLFGVINVPLSYVPWSLGACTLLLLWRKGQALGSGPVEVRSERDSLD
jgi:hypothetical protein